MAKGVKTGGRKKGVPNQTTKELREIILQFVSDNWGKVQEDFNKLEPKDRLAFMEKMLNYAVPKMQSQSIEVSEKEQPPILNITYSRRSDEIEDHKE